MHGASTWAWRRAGNLRLSSQSAAAREGDDVRYPDIISDDRTSRFAPPGQDRVRRSCWTRRVERRPSMCPFSARYS